jgi:hypothetical protein
MKVKTVNIIIVTFFFIPFALVAQRSNEDKNFFDQLPIQITPKMVEKEVKITFKEAKKYKICLRNAQGTTLYRIETQKDTTLDMTPYEKGKYVIEVIDEEKGEGLMQRIVKLEGGF